MSDTYSKFVPNKKCKRTMTYPQKYYAKKAFSRFFLGYVLMYLVSELFAAVLVYGIKKIIPLIPSNTAVPLVNFINEYYIITFAIYGFMYFIAFSDTISEISSPDASFLRTTVELISLAPSSQGKNTVCARGLRRALN